VTEVWSFGPVRPHVSPGLSMQWPLETISGRLHSPSTIV
jgi:hypothetical protein